MGEDNEGDRDLVFNYDAIISAVKEEACALAANKIDTSAPHLTTDEKLQHDITRWPLPSDVAHAIAIREAFWASMLLEEGRPCRPRLLYLPSSNDNRSVHWFKKTVPLHSSVLRKLVSAQGPLGYIVWKDAAGGPVITGIQMRAGGDPMNLITSAPAFGGVDITWLGFRLLTLRGGMIRRMSQCLLPNAQTAFGYLQTLFGSIEPAFMNRIVRAIVDQGHGGALWIVHDGCQLDGMSIGYRLESGEQTLLERYPQFAMRKHWLASIGYLAAVDGAVVLDCHARVQGFASFINCGGADDEVLRVSANGKKDRIPSSEIGGGRHRSAIAFCRKYAPAAAIVVSEDGRISVIASSNANEAPLYAEVVSLGFSDSL